jgi:hypothetical protein
MKRWQKIWLYILIIYSLLHFVRDVLQDLNVNTILSSVLVKTGGNLFNKSVLWNSKNTYLIAIIEIALALYCIKKNRFGRVGKITILIATITVVLWLVYWVS